MDKIGADFFNCVRMIEDRTGAKAVPVALPIGAETELEGLIDLVTMEEWVWKGEDLGASWVKQPVRDELKDLADEWREKMIEAAVEIDDAAMENYLENGDAPDVDALRKLLRKGCLSLSFVPVLGGSAFKNKGVQPLLNAVIDYLPSPLDVVDYMGFRPDDEEETRNVPRRADDDMPFAGLAFKIMNDPYMGTLTFTRVYSGKLAKGDQMLNSTKGKPERVGRMVMMHSNKQDEISEAFAGDIIALAGLKDTTTGDTLCDKNDPVVLETMTFPEPVIEIAVEPKTKADQEKMSQGLQRLAAEDPSFRVETDIESGQTIMKGMGELHLDILIDRLKREFKVEANIGAPQVAYRETIGHETEHTYTHKKQSGGSGQFAEVKLLITPTQPGEGFSFESKIVGGAVPKEYIPGVEKGIRSVMDSGPLAGLKDTTTGDTLCDKNDPVVLETMTFPDPVIEIAVEPRTKADQEKMSQGLQRLAAEDPSFRVETDLESGQTIMKGMGELHLDILVDRLKREFKVEANIGAPQVAYRETIGHAVEHTYTHKKQSGGSGQFAEVKLNIVPTEPGEGYSFSSKIVGGSVPKEYVPGVEKGIRSVMDSGPLAGFPVIDFRVELLDGKFHDVDSSVLAFEIAARMCMREGMRKAGAKLLEPVMKVEVVTPEEYTGGIIGDLTSRRGQVSGQSPRGNAIAIDAFVPLANMFGYINTLRSMSSGRAQFTMQFDHYDPVPQNISEEIQKKYA
jgi:translation elongation factor EF-G